MIDFRAVKEAVTEAIEEISQKHPDYKWQAEVSKKEILIYCMYPEHLEPEAPYTIRRSEVGRNDIIVARAPSGRTLGAKHIINYTKDHNVSLEDCVKALITVNIFNSRGTW